jgi:histidinol-phosphate aminotransferase
MRAELDAVNRYPDGASFALRRKLAGRLGVSEAQLVFGCGGDEMLELLAKVLLGPGREAIYAWPSFAMYPLIAKGMGATATAVPLSAALVHDLDAIAEAISDSTRLVILCNPNNPTGTSFGAGAFEAFMTRVPDDVVVCIDEAYFEYVRRDDFPDAIEWTRRRPGTAVLRTFSKIYGLAGMRVGYVIADEELAGYLHRARHPFNVNRLAEVAAVAALDDVEHVMRTQQNNDKGARYLERELAALGIESWPTDANYLLARCGTGAYDALLLEGVIVRPLQSFGMPDFVRITIGTADENERVVKALRKLAEAAS